MKKFSIVSMLVIISTFAICTFDCVTTGNAEKGIQDLSNGQSTIQPEVSTKSYISGSLILTETEPSTYEQVNEGSVPLAPPQIISLQSSMDISTSVPYNPNRFFLYTPEVVFSNTPVIIACHGYSKDEEEMSGFGKGNFALYLRVYQGYHPDAVIVFPCKEENGDWKVNDVVNLAKAFIQTYQFTGPVYYYGFSQGCLNGPDIISQYGNFKAAVFVDEDFIATAYPDKYGTPLGVKRAATLLSSLSALRIAGCTYVDQDYDRLRLAKLLNSQGIIYNEEIYPRNTYKHLEVHELTVESNIEWLLSQ